ncbi:hypothetical protein ACN47E_007370 [Coniothyrium glycines]
MAHPSSINDDQLSQFLAYIKLPQSLQSYRYGANPTTDLHFLTQLHIHTISTIPYENLWLHYNPTHTNNIFPQNTFSNIVSSARGRGGYCFQLSIFFNHILRALGYPAYLSAVRIRHRVDGIPQGEYSGWVHLVNIITLSDGSKYAVDVGFGGDGATHPVPLMHDQPHTNLGTQEIRLWRDWIPNQLHRTEETKLWIYEYRNSERAAWNAFFAFGETEAMEPDFHNLNWYTGSHPESFQTFTCIVVKFLRRPVEEGAQDDQEIYGKRMLINGLVKENVGGKTSVVQDCQTEEERLEALKKWFGIVLTEEEKKGIRGWGTELKGDGSQGVMARQAKRQGEMWETKRGKDWGFEWKGPIPE